MQTKTVVDLEKLKEKLKEEWSLGIITMADRDSVLEFLKPFCFEIRSPDEIKDKVKHFHQKAHVGIMSAIQDCSEPEPSLDPYEVEAENRKYCDLLRWVLCQKQDTWDFEEVKDD